MRVAIYSSRSARVAAAPRAARHEAECNPHSKKGTAVNSLRFLFLKLSYCAVRTVSSERFSRFTTGGATNTISTAVAAPEMIRTTRPPKT